jgi:5-oxoprolinase (ATP-hydrolysing) subunit B
VSTDIPDLRISMAGSAALLADAAGPAFNETVQERVHAATRALAALPGVREAVPGMNNFMVVFDPFGIPPEAVEAAIREAWALVEPGASVGRLVEVPVRYGGADGEDLLDHAAFAGITPGEVVERHAGALYRVAAVGAMPGFVYLSGLDPRLARPRRAVPRMRASEGAVMVGASQAGIMPCAAPTGWHILGMTDLKLFDPQKSPPAAFRPGDRIRFVPVSIVL